MHHGRRILCLVPARGGSVGVPGKNIRSVGGLPMIAHALLRAREVPWIDDLVVSTDSREIADVAASFGARVPFLRPDELARSETPMVPVLEHACRELGKEGLVFDVVLVLQANSPLLASDQIRAVLDKICTQPLDVVFTVAEAPHPPQWTIRLEDDGRPSFAFESCVPTGGDRRQDQAVLYRSTGAVYAVTTEHLRRDPSAVRLCLPAPGQRSAAIVTEPSTAVDVDSELDFALARTILESRNQGERP